MGNLLSFLEKKFVGALDESNPCFYTNLICIVATNCLMDSKVSF